MGLRNQLLSFLNELKHRNVLRVGAAYVVFAWLLVQVAETIFPLFGFDDTQRRTVFGRLLLYVITGVEGPVQAVSGYSPGVIYGKAYNRTRP